MKPIHAVLIFTAIVVLGALGLGGWVLTRKINYAWGYEARVRSTVKQMVKLECLREEK